MFLMGIRLKKMAVKEKNHEFEKIILKTSEACLTSSFGKLSYHNHLPTLFFAHRLRY